MKVNLQHTFVRFVLRYRHVVDIVLDVARPILAADVTVPYSANAKAWKHTGLLPVVNNALMHEV